MDWFDILDYFVSNPNAVETKTYNDGYEKGYDVGYKVGYEKAKEWYSKKDAKEYSAGDIVSFTSRYDGKERIGVVINKEQECFLILSDDKTFHYTENKNVKEKLGETELVNNIFERFEEIRGAQNENQSL